MELEKQYLLSLNAQELDALESLTAKIMSKWNFDYIDTFPIDDSEWELLDKIKHCIIEIRRGD